MATLRVREMPNRTGVGRRGGWQRMGTTEDCKGSGPPERAPAPSPVVSVVIPVGRVDELLEKQLHAVLAQVTSFPFEVVVSCNDPDGVGRLAVARVVKQLSDQRLRAVWSGDLASAAHARNVGARSADASIVAFCDADDEVAPGWLEALVRDVDVGVAVGGHLDEERFAVPTHEGWRPRATPGHLPAFLGVGYAVSANMAVSRSAWASSSSTHPTRSSTTAIAKAPAASCCSTTATGAAWRRSSRDTRCRARGAILGRRRGASTCSDPTGRWPAPTGSSVSSSGV
jgi:hypothetical protein